MSGAVYVRKMRGVWRVRTPAPAVWTNPLLRGAGGPGSVASDRLTRGAVACFARATAPGGAVRLVLACFARAPAPPARDPTRAGPRGRPSCVIDSITFIITAIGMRRNPRVSAHTKPWALFLRTRAWRLHRDPLAIADRTLECAAGGTRLTWLECLSRAACFNLSEPRNRFEQILA